MAKRASANFDLMVVGFLIVFLLLAFFAIVLNFKEGETLSGISGDKGDASAKKISKTLWFRFYWRSVY